MEVNNDWDLFAVVRGSGFFGLENSTTSAPNMDVKEEEVVRCEMVEAEKKVLSFSGYVSSSLWEGEEEPYKMFSLDTTAVLPQLKADQNQKRVAQMPRPTKRRKSQLQKIVRHVPVSEGLTSDLWAWRKYGQKPIKGSPYPRGYYRCSSLKGCIARKQVERDRADPSMLVITYTGEHNHAVPTHRNSLAGISRPKFPKPNSSSSPVASGDGDGELSPTTTLTGTSFEEEDHEELCDVMKEDWMDGKVSSEGDDSWFTGFETFYGDDCGFDDGLLLVN